MSLRRCCLVALVLTGSFLTSSTSFGADRPLGEDAIVSLIDLQIEDAAIIAKVKKAGISFEPAHAALDRLSKAGASEAVLQAVQDSAKAKKKPAAAGEKAVSYQDVLKLLELGIDEATILKRLEKSPTVFVLDAAQTKQLKGAGATEALIKVLQTESTHS